MLDNEYSAPLEDAARERIARQISTTAKQQHLSGQRRETFTDDISLCASCKWSQSRRRRNSNTRRMECTVFSGPCPEDIQECTEYNTITSLSLNQMAEIAIIIDNGPAKRVGFQG